MDVHHSLSQIEGTHLAGCALTIGNFDGVHLGHQCLVARARAIARPAVVLTFDPPPLAVLSPRQAPPVITPLELKLRYLQQAGADVVVVAPTDRRLLSLEPDRFVREIVVDRFAPKAVVEGPSFGFGHGRSGDVETLRELGQRHGFHVERVEPVSRLLPGHHEPTVVSSTLIRRLIGGGSVESAECCLGRPYRLVGRLVPGRGIGRTIGFPTANLDTADQLLPGEGIYAGLAHWGGRHGPAAVVVGPAPTFDVARPAVEAYLLDFAGQLDVEGMEVEVLRRLRDIERFETPADLVAQIQQDVTQVRQVIFRASRNQ